MENVDLLLINPPFHRRNGSGAIFPLGLGYILSAVDENRFTSAIIDCSQIITTYVNEDLHKLEKFLEIKLNNYNPVLVGIGPCITTQVKALKIISDCCKKCFGTERIYAGGPLASIDGQEWFFFEFLGLKYIVKGDGENATVEMLRTIKAGDKLSKCECVTNKTSFYINEIEDIDALSFPQRPFISESIISTRRADTGSVTVSMITSRGCLYNCKYCVSGNMHYKKFRKRSVENIIDEMQYLKETYGVTDIIFYDDCFFSRLSEVHNEINRFCTGLLNRHLDMTWQMEIRCDLFIKISDKDAILLYQSGCRQINLGIEKATEEGLNYLGKTVPLAGLANKIQHIKSFTGMKVAGTFILGGKDETEEDILQVIEASVMMNLDFAHYNPLFVYPGTPIYQEYFKDKREWVNYILKDNWPWGEIVYENQYVDREHLMELIDKAYERFYSKSPYKGNEMVKDRFNIKRLST